MRHKILSAKLNLSSVKSLWYQEIYQSVYPLNIYLKTVWYRLQKYYTQYNCYKWTLDSKVHGPNIGPIWGQQDPGGPHVGPMDFVIWDNFSQICTHMWDMKCFLWFCLEKKSEILRMNFSLWNVLICLVCLILSVVYNESCDSITHNNQCCFADSSTSWFP